MKWDPSKRKKHNKFRDPKTEVKDRIAPSLFSRVEKGIVNAYAKAKYPVSVGSGAYEIRNAGTANEYIVTIRTGKKRVKEVIAQLHKKRKKR